MAPELSPNRNDFFMQGTLVVEDDAKGNSFLETFNGKGGIIALFRVIMQI